MALPERIANSPTAGTREPIGTLTATLANEAGAKLKLSAKLPVPLRKTTGQCRLVIDNEIILIECAEGEEFTVITRGAEESTKAAHASGTNVFHLLTAEAIKVMNSWGIPTEVLTKRAESKTAGENAFEPSGEKDCFVTLLVVIKGSEATGAGLEVLVGGEKAAKLIISELATQTNQQIPVTFLVPAGKKWEWKKGEASKAPENVYSTYQFKN